MGNVGVLSMSETNQTIAAKAAPAERLTSIDALRGFDMFWIMGGGDLVKLLSSLILNPMPAAVSRQFDHAEWIGFHAWDLIMPLFLFIVGTSLPFSMSKHIGQKEGRGRVYLRLLKRFALLFIFGMAVQGNLLKFDLSKLHLYSNTLQAIACGYVVAAVLILNVRAAWQAVSCFALLIGYLLLMRFVPVPGYGAGVVAPDANLALYIDTLILGRFRDGAAYTWILSSMTFSATVLFGVFSGHILRAKISQGRRFWMLAGAGVFCTAAGLILGIWFPIIKHIWSSSFTLFAAGLCYLLLAAFYGVIDILNIRRWSFFLVVIGANALFVYLFTEFLFNGLPSSIGNALEAMPAYLSGAIGLSVLAAFWMLLYYMYKKRIFLRV